MEQTQRNIYSGVAEGKLKDNMASKADFKEGRFQKFWGVLGGKTGKVVLNNLLTLVFFLPLIAVVIWRGVVVQAQGQTGPYGGNLGIGYPGIPDITGVWESFILSANTVFFALIALSGIIAAVGIAGCAHSMRYMLLKDGDFSVKEYFKGVKSNFLPCLAGVLFFSLFLYLDVWVFSFSSYMNSIGEGSAGFFVFLRVVAVILNVLAGFIALWMIAIGANYKTGFFRLLKNAFIMTAGTIFQTIIFAAAALAPLALLFTGNSLIVSIAMVFLILLGFSYVLLVWLSFTQWAFDSFVTAGAKTASETAEKKEKREEKENKTLSREEEALEAYRMAIALGEKSVVLSRPIKPLDDGIELYSLPGNYSREDLKKVKDSKDVILSAQSEYEKQHKNEKKFVEYNKQFENRDKALQPVTDKKGRLKNKPALLSK